MALVEKVFRIGIRYYNSSAWPILLGGGDFLGALLRGRLTWHLAMRDIRLRYRRTTIGPFWTVLNSSVFIFAIGLIYGTLFGADLETYLPYFSASYFIWMMIVQILTESADAFTSADAIIRSMRVPQGVHVQRVIVRNLVVFLHTIPVLVAILAVFSHTPALYGFWAIPLGLLLVVSTMFFVALISAIMCTRFRDVKQIVTLVVQIAFLATPIIWKVEHLGGHPLATAILVDANPFFHLIEVLRAPIMGTAVPIESYIYLAIANAVLGLFALDLHGRKKPHIAVWL